MTWGMSRETFLVGLIVIGCVFFIIAVPCICTTILGLRLFNKLAYFPSKTPAIQLSILKWFVVLFFFSFGLLFLFYQIMVDTGASST